MGPDSLGVSDALASAGIIAARYDELGALGKAIESGEPVPATVLAACAPGAGPADPTSTGAAARQAAAGALALVQSWIAYPRFGEGRLVLVTGGAVATAEGEAVPGLAHAPVWGLIRTAQSEHPATFAVVDTDGTERSRRALAAAIRSGEPQLALRGGDLLVPRLRRMPRPDGPTGQAARSIDPEGTVLVTGGTGRLGVTIARHLVTAHGARHLLLISRQGRQASGATAVESELTQLGAHVTIAACDAADRDALARLLERIPPAHPLTAVVHAAGTIDDGVVRSLTAEQMDVVMRPKADSAVNLHNLTRHADLAAFILFSSAAGLLGGGGQGNYAAANAFLDALAQHRRSQGLPATSLAWGLWAERSGITGGLRKSDLDRIRRAGMAALSVDEGLRLFDEALGAPGALLAPMSLDLAAMQARSDAVPAILGDLVTGAAASAPGPQSAEAGQVRRRLLALNGEQRQRALVEFVQAQAAAVLGFGDGTAIKVGQPLLEIGFDSLTTLELRNQLTAATSLPLAATIFFDGATPATIADHLMDQLTAGGGGAGEPVVPAAGDTIDVLYRQACGQRRIIEGNSFLMAAAELRPVFTQPPGPAEMPAALRLSSGPESPRLLCFPTVAASSSAIHYARFANHLQGLRDVLVVPVPGFEGEPLPATLDVLIETLAQATLHSAGGAPFALVGYSAGGWLANAVATYLEERGARPAGVILLDTYFPDTRLALIQPQLTRGMFEREGILGKIGHVRWTAMGGYLRLFTGYTPAGTLAPTLLVQATQPVPDEADAPASDPEIWRHITQFPVTVADVPGDHFTLMEEHADATARLVHTWLATQQLNAEQQINAEER